MKTTQANAVSIRTSHRNRKPRKSARRSILATSASALLALFGLAAPSSAVVENFTFNPALAIPDGNLAGAANLQTPASLINVIQGVTVNLNIGGVPANLGFNGDLYVYLSHITPGGSGITVLLNRTGLTGLNPLGYADSGFNITLSDAAATDVHLYQPGTIPAAGTPLTGTFQADGRNIAPNSPGAAFDVAPRTTLASAFNGLSAKGGWTLFVADASGGNQHILNSWSLNLTGLSGPFHWKGGTNGLWTGVVNNWAADAAGTINILATPTSTDEVIFSTTNAANRGTTLGADFTINRLTMTDSVGAVQINGANTLTLSGSAGTGIDVQAGALSLTIGANLTLAGASNTINVNNVAGATINGIIGGANGLIKTGTGTLTLGGTNNYTGATNINAGTLSLSATGSTPLASTVNVGTAGTLAGTGTVFGNATVTGNGIINFGVGGQIANTLGVTGGRWNGGGTVTGDVNVTSGTLTIGPAANLTTNGTVNVSGAATISGGATSTITGNVNVTSTVGVNYAGAIAGGASTVTVNNPGAGAALILSGTNTYGGLTTVAGGFLIASSANALGAIGAGTLVQSGGALGINGLVAVTAEPLTINGAGNANFANSGAALVGGVGASFAGPITLGSNATIGASLGGTFTLTGGIDKSGRVLTLLTTQGTNGVININGPGNGGFGIRGAAANSDLVVDHVTVNENIANDYNGPTFIRSSVLAGTGILNANVANALPTANGRSVVTLDDSGLGGSRLNLGASQSIASLASPVASSIINLNANALTIGATGGTTNFAGVISGAGATANLIKDGTSVQILSGASTYGGTTTILNGTLRADVTDALPATSAVTINPATGATGGTLNINGAGVTQNVPSLTINAPLAASTAVTGTGTLALNGTLSVVNNILMPGSGAATTINVATLALGAVNRAINVQGQNGNPADLRISSAITGSAGYTISAAASTFNNGIGMVALDGAATNTNSGTVTVNTGNLLLTRTTANASIAGDIVIGDNAPDPVSLVLANSARATLAIIGQIANSSNMTINADGQFNMAGIGEAINNLTINSGNVINVPTAGGSTDLGLVGNLFMTGGSINGGLGVTNGLSLFGPSSSVTATSEAAGAAAIHSNVTLFALNRTFTVNRGPGAQDLIITGVVQNGSPAGSVSITKAGAGFMQLSGLNTYTGQTLITDGQITVTQSTAGTFSALGFGDNTLPQGTIVDATAQTAKLVLANGVSITNEFLQLKNGGQLALATPGGTGTWGGPIQIVGGPGTLDALGGTLNVGTLDKTDVNLTLTDSLNSAKGVATINVNGAITGNLVGYDDDLFVTGVTANLNAANTFLGPTHISSTASGVGVGAGNGVLNANVAAAIPVAFGRSAVDMDLAGTGGSTLNIGGTLAFPAGFNQAIASLVGTANSSVTLGANTLTIGFGTAPNTNGTANAVFAGVISGSGGIFKDDTSTQILTGANTFLGQTRVNGGVLQIGDGVAAAASLAASVPVIVDAAGTLALQLVNGGTFTNNVTNNGIVRGINTVGNTQTISGVITGTGNLLQTGAGFTVLTNINTYQGGTVIGGSGRIVVGDGAQQGSVGTGNVTFNGPGGLTLVNVNGNVFPNNVSNTSAGLGVIRMIPALATTTTISGALTSAGAGQDIFLIQSGPGTTILTNAANNTSASGTFSNDAVINAGTLQVGTNANPSMVGSNAPGRFITVSGGTLSLVNVVGNTINSSLINFFGGASTVNIHSLNNNTLAGPITTTAGTLALTQTGTGTTTLTSAANDIVGSVSVSAGGLTIGTGALPSRFDAAGTVPVSVGTGGTLTLVNLVGNALANNIGNTLGGAGSVVVNSANNNTLSGILSNAAGTLSLTQSGAGTTTLTGANTYTGATLVSAGTLQIGDGAIGSINGAGAVTVNAGAFLDLNLANGGIFANNVANSGSVQGLNTVGNTQTVSGVISGTGNFLQSVTGTTVFTSNNTYQGGTVIGNGTNVNRPILVVGSGAQQGSVGTGNVTFNGGGGLTLVNVNGNLFANNVSNATVGNAVFRQDEAAGITTTITGAITSAGGGQNLHFWHTGGGTTILTNAGNIYTSQFIDNTTIQAGVLQIGTAASPSLAGANAAGRFISVTTGGTLTLVNIVGNTLNNNLLNTFGGTGTVNVNSANNNTLAGSIALFINGGTIPLNQIGSGTTTLTSAVNDIVGGVTVSNGGLTIGTGALASRLDAAGTVGVNVGTGGTLTLVNLVGNALANNIGNTLGGAGSVVVNSGNTNTLSGILSNAAGTLSLTQSGAGTTTLTGANTYTGATNVTGGTLRVGDGTSGNIVSSPINISGGATLVVNLANTATLGGNIVNGGTVIGLNASPNSQTLSGNISGGGTFAQTGTGTTFLTGANTYTGATSVAAGTLRVNGSLGATTVTVLAGATLGGNGIIGGPVNVLGGGTLAPGTSPGTLTVGSLTLTNAGGGSNSNFELNLPGIVGQAALPGNDLVNVTGQLTLAGNINVIQNPTISAGSYRLFNYGTLINNGTTLLPSPVGAGLSGQLVFGVTGQVNLLVLNSAAIGITQFWDGAHANNTTIEGGTASWDNFNNNWTDAAGTTNSSWQNGVANFGGVAGTVTLGDNVHAQGLVFGTTGYVIQGSGAYTLNLVGGTVPAPFLTVTSGLTATINAQILNNSLGVTSNGGGTLVLGNAANAYTGGTTIVGGGAVSIAADGALGATGVGNGITLGDALTGGTLMATATFNSARTVALAGAGTVDVTNANVLTLSGIISGAGALTKVDTGTLNLTGANGYLGGTSVVAGILQITNDGNLGAAAGGLTLGGLVGGNAMLQTLGAVTSARGVTLNAGGGTIDTNGFASTLSGIIGGAAGNPLTKASLGTLTVTGASTYLGQTNVNGGTLQVGDGATAGTQIGNNLAASTVVIGNGGTLAINLPAAGTFANNVTNNFGGVLNAISAANSQTISGIITGAGVFNQNGAGTTILTGANAYTGATNALLGHLQIGDGTTGNLNVGTAVSVSGGAFLDLNLANNAIFAPAGIADSGTVQGINTVGNTQTVSGVISGTGAFAQTGAGTTIFTNVNSFGGGTTINNAGIVQVGTLALTGALGSGGVTLGNAGGTLNLVNVSGNTFANNVAGTGGIDTVNVSSANTNTLSGAFTGSLSLNQIGGGTTILTNAGNTYTAGTRVSPGVLQVGTAGLAGSIGQNLAANGISVAGGGTLMLVNLAAGSNPLLNNITNGVGSTGLVNANSATTITLGGTLTNGVLGTLSLTQSGTGTTILTSAGNTYTGATNVTAGTLQIGTGVSAGSIGATAVVVQTGGILSLVNVATGTFANNVSNGVLGTGTVNAGNANPLTISGILSDGAAGQLTFTQSGAGTTTLTNSSTYTGATNVNAGTLQIGNGTGGNIASPQINVAGAATLGVNLANNQTLAGNIANAGTINANNTLTNTQTIAGNISGLGAFNQTGAGTTILTGASTYSGATTVGGNGNLRVNGSLGNTAVTVQSGATLSGTGSIAGSVSILAGGNLNPGTSPGTITVGSLTLVAGSNSNFELGVPGVIGQAALPGNDLINVNTNLVLAGNINVTPIASFGAGSYRLFNYGGVLTNNGTIVSGVPSPQFSSQVITGIPGQVNLLVLNANAIGLVQNWDGPHADNVTIEGGNGTWDGFQTNWTNNAGNVNAAWQNGVANFGGATGTVTLASPIFAQGLAFTTTGYNINGTGINVLNLVGPTPAPTITVSPTLVATINAQILGSLGLTSDGAGTLVLTNAGNSYTGGTTVTGTGAVSVSSDGNLGAAAGAITLNNGTLQTTATFASARGFTLTNTGTFDVTNANVFTASGVIGGTGVLTKINTGTLVLANAGNTYNGPTNIVNGTVQVSANGNLGAVAGGITFGGAAGNNAILQTTAGINFGLRAVTLNTAGGTIDTNGFNSTLGGVIGGAAGNPLTKVGAGTLTVTGISTYLGQTNVNGGTLQVGDGVVVGTQIGNGTAAVVLNNGATLAINLANNGIFGNPVTANAGSTVLGNNTVGNTQTVSGIISGLGGVTQSGAGTTILTAANGYNGPTLVTAGTLQVGNGVAVGSSIANSITTTVNVGATLAIQLAANETFSNNVTDNGTVNLLSANTQTIAGIIGGAGVLNQNGAGTAILTGNNTYAGITTINAGTLQIGNGGVSGSLGTGNVVDNGALVFNRSDSIVVGNLISGTGTLTQQGVGVTTLIATNTYSGATTVAFGTLQIGNGSTVGSSIANSTPAVLVNAGATLAINLANGETFTNGVTDNGSVNGISNSTQTLSGNITGGGVLNQNGTGTMILTGTNSYAGVTTINAGRLQIGNGGATGTLGLGNVVDNGALIFNRNNTMTVANLISGNGSVSQQGVGGTTILTAANSYSGPTTVTQGTLQIGDGATAGASIANSSSTTVNLGAVLAINLANGETFTNNVTDNGAVNGISANTQTISGAITGSGALNQNGTGTTILTGTNSYQGTTTITAGTLQIGNGGTIGTLGSGNVVDNGALVFNRSNLMTVANLISGTGTVTQQGTGITILTATNTYNGATTVAFGTLQIGDGATPNASIANSAVTVNPGATLAINLAPNETFVNNVLDNGAVNGISTNTQTLSGVISGNGTLNQNGTGRTILTGNNTYAGVTTINAGTLQVGAGGVTGSLGGGNVVDNGALIFNRSDAITVANLISGTGTLTQQGTGTTTLTGNNTYGGVTSVNFGTLQIGDGASGNITSPQVNVAAGAALAVNLANNATLVGNIANTGTINAISANTQTLSGNIIGTGVFNQTGTGITILTGASTYTGATTVVNGNLRVNGSLGNTAVTVQIGATLSGNGSIAGNVTFNTGSNLNPGTSPGTLTLGNTFFNAGSNLNFELGVPGVIGQQVLPGNDLVNVNGNLTLDGILNVTPLAGFGSGSYRLFNYTGTLTNNIVDTINGVPAGPGGFTPMIITSVPQQVILLTLSNGPGPVQFWDGGGLPNDGIIAGGTGNWDGFATNWTNNVGNPNASWQNGRAIFAGTAGTVTAVSPVFVQDLFFLTDGYVVNGTGGFGLNLVGPAPAPTINVIAAATATINAQISGGSGLTSNGAGTLVLTNVGNNYTGGTVITGGGTVSISADGNLGAIPGGVDPVNITLNNGILQATATFALNTNRGITLAGAGGIDVTAANRFTVGSVITGIGSLAKTGTGILTLSGVNTYQGGTLILGGTLEISNDNNLGNVAGNVTFGNGATLKTLAGITSARGISLDGGAGGGGVIDTNGFNSTLTGIITGAAGNGLVKNGAGILTVTGASTYLGTTTINTGTLQVGDNATVGAQIGNNAANVIVGAGAILDVRLTNGGTFNNPIATALGATVNSTNNAGATQTFGGIISGAGIFNQNGLGTAVLNGANTYTGQTNVNFGTVVLGNATALGTIAAGTVVASGATLDLNGQTVGAEALTIGGAGVGGNGALINGNIAVAASLSGPVSLTADTTITTNSANANATPGGSITLSGNVSGGFGIIKNGNGTLTLTGLNIYTGQTLVNAGILQAGNNFALGSVGANTVVANGASLQILNGVAVVGEPVTINGFGAGVAAPGAITQSLNGSSSLAGPITVATNANISTNGTGILTLTGGITKNATTLTLNGGGTININGVGISGATIFTSDLVIDGTGVGGLTVVNLNAQSSYAGPTWITNGGTLNANVVGALPSLVSDGGIAAIRTTVIMDPVAPIVGTPPSPSPSTGGSILNLGANQAIQSLTGAALPAPSLVNLGTNTLTIGTNLVSNTTFAGIISGANPAGASIIKDGTSTQIFGGPGSAGNTYTGSTNVNGGTLQAGVITTAFGVNSAVTIGAAGTLDIAGFSNTIGSLAGAAGAVVQSTGGVATLTTGALNTSTNYAGVLQDGAGGQLLLIKNGTGTQTLSGPAGNTFTGLTLVNAGELHLNKAPGFNAIGGNLTIGDGAGGANADIVKLLASNQIIDTSVVLINGTSGKLDLNNFNETIASIADTGVVTPGGSSVTLGTGTLTLSAAAGTATFSGIISGANPAGASIVKLGASTQVFAGPNTYTGSTTVNGGALQAGIATNAFGNNSAVTIGAAGTLNLAGFSNTIGSLAGAAGGIVQSTGGVATLTTGALNTSTNFAGVLQNGAGGTLLLVKNGTGTQTLSGPASNTFTGLTTVNGGVLDLNKTGGSIAVGGNLTIGDGSAPGANSDIVRLLANNQIIATSLVLINGTSGRLDLNGNSQTVGSIADTGAVTVGGSSINLGSGTLTTGAGGGANPANPNTTFSGVISGANGNLTKTGTGIFTLNGTNTYTGATNVNAGTLRAGSTQAFGINSAVTIAAVGTLDLAGNSNTIGSLAGAAGGFVLSSTGAATLTTGDLNTSTVFAGVLQDNVGPLSLVKNGTGVQTLSGTNTYTGTTTVNGGSLLAASTSAFGINSATTVNAGGTLDLGGNSNTVGSLAGVAGGIVQSTGGPATLTTGALNTNVTFNGTIQNGSGTLAFVKNGTGTQILSGTNSFTGGLTMNAGTLAAGSTKAFGSGNLTLVGGTLRTNGGPLVVNIGSGNVLFSGGTYIANVGGTIPGTQHDQLTTTGTANVGGGTLALVQQNAFQLAPGAQVNLLVATGGVAGGSALGTPVPAANVTGLGAFSSTPLLVPVVNLYPTTVTLEAMQGSFANLGGVFGPNGQFIPFTPNQRATAAALDSVAKGINFKTGILKELNFLDTQPLGTLPSNLDKIAPEEFAAFFQNSVALANVQTANLGRRMEDIRNQAPVASASGFAAAGSGPSYSGGLSGPSGKRSKEIIPADDARWGAFLTGSGEFTRVGSTTNAAGYRFETAGVTGGVDYRVNDHFAVGMHFGYVGTTSSLVNGGKIDTDGGRLGLYATYFDENFHVDAAVTGGLNSYDTRRTTPNNTAAIASPEGSEINILIAAGYDWKFGKFTVGPTASYQYTNVHTDAFTETGAFAPLNVNSQNSESSRTSLGIRAYYEAQVAGIVIRPEVRLAWQHEFGDAASTVTSRFSTLGGNPFTVTGPQIGRDSLLLGAGFTVLWSERLATYLYYDGEVGRSNYDSHNISGGIRLQF